MTGKKKKPTKKDTKIANTALVHLFSEDEQIVAMMMDKGTVYVATNRGVYYIRGDKLYRLNLSVAEEVGE